MNSRHETERITCNGVTLNVIRAGPTNGAPVVLLHGFPEPASLCWQRQIRPLGEAGLRLLAPDQRGYNTSDKPEGVAAYTLDVLAADVLGILDAQGLPTAALVGHDWGGIVAWWTALRHPQRVERLAILNAPHPVAGQRYILTHPRQMLKSWYVFFFQLPGLPEAHLKRGNWRPLCRALQKTNRPGIFTENDLDEYRRAWSEPGAIKAMINWYRACRGEPYVLRPGAPGVGRRGNALGPARGATTRQPAAHRLSGWPGQDRISNDAADHVRETQLPRVGLAGEDMSRRKPTIRGMAVCAASPPGLAGS
jgi:pimeloyl-ACP methyl ester carboxylesterase